MFGWLRLTDEQRKTSINQASVRKGMQEKAIEKDWWVTLVLKALFSTPYAKFFTFKGGTSLSKGWKLIERLSEDIDIILDPEALGYEYKKNPSHTYIKKLKKEACVFTSTRIKDALQKQLEVMGLPQALIAVEAEVVPETMPDKDPQSLIVRYKSLFPPHPYLADEVKIEFSIRSLKEPSATINILSVLFEVFPNKAYEETPFEVRAVEPRKTLLEKTFLLHEKFMTTDADELVGERQSRHLYDLVKMMNTDTEKAVLNDRELYITLQEHRKNYMYLGGFDYSTLHWSTLSFVPTEKFKEVLRKDYSEMQLSMIYGEFPDFENMINQLKLLNGKIRLMDEDYSLEEIIDRSASQLKNKDADQLSIVVVYPVDPASPLGYRNRFTKYKVDFSLKDGRLIFENISIIKNNPG